MTGLSIALLELLRKYQGDPQLDALREGVRLMAEALVELKVTQQVGAGTYERSPHRRAHRNGYRERAWDTRVGTIALRIPKLREGSYFPSLLERRRRAEKALLSVVQETPVEEREVLGFAIGQAESYEFWSESLRTLVRRGLKGVMLVISDAHEGLKRAVAEILAGASWQRCRVHVMRNLLSLVPKQAQVMVSALVRTIFVQPDAALAQEQLERVAESLRLRYPKAAERLLEAAEDVLTYMAFPPEHWRQIHSTNPLERLNREIGRRTDVVGIFPNPRRRCA